MAKEHFKFNFEEWMAEELIHRDDWKDWYKAMCDILPLWEVNTAERVAMFVAQCGHESGGFRVLSENLNYSAKHLIQFFLNILDEQVEMQMNIIDNLKKSQTLFTLHVWTTAILIAVTAGAFAVVASFS